MKTINAKLLKKFTAIAGEKLNGEWVLMGGTVLPLLGSEYRTTTDIDFVGVTEAQQKQTLKLMQIAEDLGLPVETINQAGAFFLLKISDFRKHLVLLHQGSKATIYRPDLKLFLQLKIARLSESDLSDCIEFIRLAKSIGESFDKNKILSMIEKEEKKAGSEGKKVRLKNLEMVIKRGVRRPSS